MSCIDSGYYTAAVQHAKSIRNFAVADSAIQLALALHQRNSSKDITAIQYDTADKQMKLAEETLAHSEKYWPYEKAFVEQMMNAEDVNPNYIGTSNRWGDIVDDEFIALRENHIENMADNCLPVSLCDINRISRMNALVKSDALSYAVRQEENRAQAINDRNYSRQNAALALGRGMMQQAQSYVTLSGAIGASTGSMLGNILSAALEVTGFVGGLSRVEFAGRGRAARNVLEGSTVPSAPPPIDSQIKTEVKDAVMNIPTNAQIYEVMTKPVTGDKGGSSQRILRDEFSKKGYRLDSGDKSIYNGKGQRVATFSEF